MAKNAIAKRKPISQSPKFLALQSRARALTASKGKALAKAAEQYRVMQYVAAAETVGGSFLAGYLPAKLGMYEVAGVDLRVIVGLLGTGASMALPRAVGNHVLALSTGFLCSYAHDLGEGMALQAAAPVVVDEAAA